MDAELRALLLEEIDRRAAEIVASPTPTVARRVAHALKGALGLASERESSEAFARLERRLAAGEERSVGDLRELVTRLNSLLRDGQSLPRSTWPEPPEDIRSGAADQSARAEYIAATRDRVARIDAALAARDPEHAAREIYRELHTMKGSALAMGDELMAWFCHGLEERVKATKDEATARAALETIEKYRGVLAEIVDAPEHALVTLRLMTGSSIRAPRAPLITPLPLPPRRPAVDIPTESDARGLADDGTVRVSSTVLDGLFERAGHLRQLQAPISSSAGELLQESGALRELQRDLKEALRLIGPPRPWGAPAAAISSLERCAAKLLSTAGMVERTSSQMGGFASRLSREKEELSAAIGSLRTGFASTLFERVAAAAESEARREGKLVDVVVAGGDTPIDRRLVEALVEPMRQLARNAVVHGLEAPEARVASGKPERGVLRLSAQLRAGVLELVVADDGAGVGVDHVRSLARERGLLSESVAVDDREVLALLFYPGLSLRPEAELHAGRGVGLDLTLAAVQRIGGTIAIDTQLGRGLCATVAVPAEGALVRVIWIGCAGQYFALPVHHAGEVRTLEDAPSKALPLCDFLGRVIDRERVKPARIALEVLPPTADRTGAWVAVEELGSIDEVALRALPPIVRATGPWSAGIIWADDLRFSLDPVRIADAARASPESVRPRA